jgi:hypothetical protein
VIDFGTGSAGQGGTVTQNGSNAIGLNIPVGLLSVTIGNSMTTYNTSGAANGVSASNVAALSFNTAANTITIVGGIPTLGIANGTTLLTGTFSSVSVTNQGGVLLSVSGSGPDTKSQALLQALGVPLNTQFQFFGFSISSILNGNTYNAFSTDIANTAVPEPTSMLLLGSVLVSVCTVLRRRTSTSVN